MRIIIIEKWNGTKPNLMLRETKQSNLPLMNLHLDRGVILPISVEISTIQVENSRIEENYSIPTKCIKSAKWESVI